MVLRSGVEKKKSGERGRGQNVRRIESPHRLSATENAKGEPKDCQWKTRMSANVGVIRDMQATPGLAVKDIRGRSYGATHDVKNLPNTYLQHLKSY